ncbi:MAG TPA: phosphoenolpyruvate carboxykinase (ATP) [Chitinophagaceae bacterium]|nr:phosphoenolpyruvate carboxykinase (ATP) [Chitinophagaceae bacterium]
MMSTVRTAPVPLIPGFVSKAAIHYQLTPQQLIFQVLEKEEGILNDTGALCINTGKFTGRCPQDKFIVRDAITEDNINWGKFNIPVEESYFHQLKQKMLAYLETKNELWMRDCYACADPAYRLNIRVINETAWSNLFCFNMFLRPAEEELIDFNPSWSIIHAPGFSADPRVDGTRSSQFAVISFTHRTILIGGTAYTGEIKKGIFTVLNFLLPHNKEVLSMHCSANIGRDGDVALFFGLSGTGKTTLSADPERNLVGDDEHGWDAMGIFNFEGGCYAKVIGLSKEKEPAIYNAIREGALVENVSFLGDSPKIDFNSAAITENTRVSYPLNFIENAVIPSTGDIPQNIFFLTCDAYGVLPAVSRLSSSQAMFQFISGYTAKIAGTETGITEPKATFSTCFGAPFMPLHPAVYAKLLGQKMQEHSVNVWMINTGWIGGPYGTGKRIPLEYTRAIIRAALNGSLNYMPYEAHPVFGVQMPKRCPGVPETLLNPRYTWRDRDAYDEAADRLARLFANNFAEYDSGDMDDAIRKAVPKKRVAHFS